MEHSLLGMGHVGMLSMTGGKDYSANQEDAINLWLRERDGYESFKGGFERLRPLFQPLANDFKSHNIKIATIGGTNGKGETALRLGEYLIQNGSSCATWMSPHILSLRERFLRQNQPISYSSLKKVIKQCRHLIPQLSFYEFHFYVFCQWALQPPTPDFLVLEVGMGGRLDAVNLFDADVCAVTSISLDHCEYLGDTPEQILREKLGISRPERPLFTSLDCPALREQCRRHAFAKSIPWQDIFTEEKDYRERNDLMARTLCHSLTGIFPHSHPLQPLKGRWEKMIYRTNTLLFVGAHNEDGIKKMLEAADRPPIDKILVSFSRRPLSEMKACLETLCRSEPPVPLILTWFDHPRGINSAACHEILSHSQLSSTITFEYNWRNVVSEETDTGQTLLVCGSYYFLGEVQKWLYQQNLGAHPLTSPLPGHRQRNL